METRNHNVLGHQHRFPCGPPGGGGQGYGGGGQLHPSSVGGGVRGQPPNAVLQQHMHQPHHQPQHQQHYGGMHNHHHPMQMKMQGMMTYDGGGASMRAGAGGGPPGNVYGPYGRRMQGDYPMPPGMAGNPAMYKQNMMMQGPPPHQQHQQQPMPPAGNFSPPNHTFMPRGMPPGLVNRMQGPQEAQMGSGGPMGRYPHQYPQQHPSQHPNQRPMMGGNGMGMVQQNRMHRPGMPPQQQHLQMMNQHQQNMHQQQYPGTQNHNTGLMGLNSQYIGSPPPSRPHIMSPPHPAVLPQKQTPSQYGSHGMMSPNSQQAAQNPMNYPPQVGGMANQMMNQAQPMMASPPNPTNSAVLASQLPDFRTFTSGQTALPGGGGNRMAMHSHAPHRGSSTPHMMSPPAPPPPSQPQMPSPGQLMVSPKMYSGTPPMASPASSIHSLQSPPPLSHPSVPHGCRSISSSPPPSATLSSPPVACTFVSSSTACNMGNPHHHQSYNNHLQQPHGPQGPQQPGMQHQSLHHQHPHHHMHPQELQHHHGTSYAHRKTNCLTGIAVSLPPSLPGSTSSLSIMTTHPQASATSSSSLSPCTTACMTMTTACPTVTTTCTSAQASVATNVVSCHSTVVSCHSLGTPLLGGRLKQETCEKQLSVKTTVESVCVPFGWRRVVEAGAVVYYSPSGIRLASVELIRQYLQTEGTCKCGLECPLHVDKTFNFDPQVTSKPWRALPASEEHSPLAGDLTKLCNHKRKALAMASLQNSAMQKKGESSHTGDRPSRTSPDGKRPSSTGSAEKEKACKRMTKKQQHHGDELLYENPMVAQLMMEAKHHQTGHLGNGGRPFNYHGNHKMEGGAVNPLHKMEMLVDGALQDDHMEGAMMAMNGAGHHYGSHKLGDPHSMESAHPQCHPGNPGYQMKMPTNLQMAMHHPGYPANHKHPNFNQAPSLGPRFSSLHGPHGHMTQPNRQQLMMQGGHGMHPRHPPSEDPAFHHQNMMMGSRGCLPGAGGASSDQNSWIGPSDPRKKHPRTSSSRKQPGTKMQQGIWERLSPCPNVDIQSLAKEELVQHAMMHSGSEQDLMHPCRTSSAGSGKSMPLDKSTPLQSPRPLSCQLSPGSTRSTPKSARNTPVSSIMASLTNAGASSRADELTNSIPAFGSGVSSSSSMERDKPHISINTNLPEGAVNSIFSAVVSPKAKQLPSPSSCRAKPAPGPPEARTHPGMMCVSEPTRSSFVQSLFGEKKNSSFPASSLLSAAARVQLHDQYSDPDPNSEQDEDDLFDEDALLLNGNVPHAHRADVSSSVTVTVSNPGDINLANLTLMNAQGGGTAVETSDLQTSRMNDCIRNEPLTASAPDGSVCKMQSPNCKRNSPQKRRSDRTPIQMVQNMITGLEATQNAIAACLASANAEEEEEKLQKSKDEQEQAEPSHPQGQRKNSCSSEESTSTLSSLNTLQNGPVLSVSSTKSSHSPKEAPPQEAESAEILTGPQLQKTDFTHSTEMHLSKEVSDDIHTKEKSTDVSDESEKPHGYFADEDVDMVVMDDSGVEATLDAASPVDDEHIEGNKSEKEVLSGDSVADGTSQDATDIPREMTPADDITQEMEPSSEATEMSEVNEESEPQEDGNLSCINPAFSVALEGASVAGIVTSAVVSIPVTADTLTTSAVTSMAGILPGVTMATALLPQLPMLHMDSSFSVPTLMFSPPLPGGLVSPEMSTAVVSPSHVHHNIPHSVAHETHSITSSDVSPGSHGSSRMTMLTSLFQPNLPLLQGLLHSSQGNLNQALSQLQVDSVWQGQRFQELAQLEADLPEQPDIQSERNERKESEKKRAKSSRKKERRKSSASSGGIANPGLEESRDEQKESNPNTVSPVDPSQWNLSTEQVAALTMNMNLIQMMTLNPSVALDPNFVQTFQQTLHTLQTQAMQHPQSALHMLQAMNYMQQHLSPFMGATGNFAMLQQQNAAFLQQFSGGQEPGEILAPIIPSLAPSQGQSAIPDSMSDVGKFSDDQGSTSISLNNSFSSTASSRGHSPRSEGHSRSPRKSEGSDKQPSNTGKGRSSSHSPRRQRQQKSDQLTLRLQASDLLDPAVSPTVSQDSLPLPANLTEAVASVVPADLLDQDSNQEPTHQDLASVGPLKTYQPRLKSVDAHPVSTSSVTMPSSSSESLISSSLPTSSESSSVLSHAPSSADSSVVPVASSATEDSLNLIVNSTSHSIPSISAKKHRDSKLSKKSSPMKTLDVTAMSKDDDHPDSEVIEPPDSIQIDMIVAETSNKEDETSLYNSECTAEELNSEVLSTTDSQDSQATECCDLVADPGSKETPPSQPDAVCANPENALSSEETSPAEIDASEVESSRCSDKKEQKTLAEPLTTADVNMQNVSDRTSQGAPEHLSQKESPKNEGQTDKSPLEDQETLASSTASPLVKRTRLSYKVSSARNITAKLEYAETDATAKQQEEVAKDEKVTEKEEKLDHKESALPSKLHENPLINAKTSEKGSVKPWATQSKQSALTKTTSIDKVINSVMEASAAADVLKDGNPLKPAQSKLLANSTLRTFSTLTKSKSSAVKVNLAAKVVSTSRPMSGQKRSGEPLNGIVSRLKRKAEKSAVAKKSPDKVVDKVSHKVVDKVTDKVNEVSKPSITNDGQKDGYKDSVQNCIDGKQSSDESDCRVEGLNQQTPEVLPKDGSLATLDGVQKSVGDSLEPACKETPPGVDKEKEAPSRVIRTNAESNDRESNAIKSQGRENKEGRSNSRVLNCISTNKQTSGNVKKKLDKDAVGNPDNKLISKGVESEVGPISDDKVHGMKRILEEEEPECSHGETTDDDANSIDELGEERSPRHFDIGDLVWGPLRGFPQWPGKLVHETEVRGNPKSENGKVWVRWFGEHSFTQVEPDHLKTLTEGLDAHHNSRQNHRKGRKIQPALEEAIMEAMNELDRQSEATSQNENKMASSALKTPPGLKTSGLLKTSPPCVRIPPVSAPQDDRSANVNKTTPKSVKKRRTR